MTTTISFLPPHELSDEEKIRLVDEVLNNDFDELTKQEKIGVVASVAAEGLSVDKPFRIETIFASDKKLQTLFPKFVETKKIIYPPDVFSEPTRGYLKRLPIDKLKRSWERLLEITRAYPDVIHPSLLPENTRQEYSELLGCDDLAKAMKETLLEVLKRDK